MSGRVAAGVVAVAAAAALLLPHNRVGLGAALVGAAVAGVAWSTAGMRDRWGSGLLLLAAALTLTPLLRDAAWLVTLDLLAAAAVATVAVTGAQGWRSIAAAPATTSRRVLAAWPAVARAAAGPLAARLGPGFPPLIRGLAVGAVLVTAFGSLFVSADDAFAEIVDDTVVPHWDLGLLPARSVTFLAVGGLAGALALSAVGGRIASPQQPARAALARAEWAIPLALVDALFLAFVLVQIAVLFGGRDHVLETAGLTYAEYARQGFWELLAVAAMTLGVIAVAVRRAAPADRRLLHVLLGVLCALTFVVLASALRRLGLYEDAFGFTRARLMAHVAILWLGALFVLVLAAGALQRSDWLPRAIVALTAATLLGLTVANPDGLIASHNVDRHRETKKLDTAYVGGLSADAVPALAGLPPDLAACVTVQQRARLAEREAWHELNAGRERARSSLRALGHCP